MEKVELNMERSERKARHIKLSLDLVDGPVTTGFEQMYLLNDSLPELDWNDIDLSICLAGKKLSLPVLINAMTGGTEKAVQINSVLAGLACDWGLGMAVGSQAVAIHNPEWCHSFAVAREKNPCGLIIANINAGTEADKALQAIKMIAADAIQLHFNIPQELAMAEGDRNFRGVAGRVKRILDQVTVPVIAKEVGFGFSRNTVSKLFDLGIRIFDVGGQGGTNFLQIEDTASDLFNHELDNWGIPSAVSLAEIADMDLPVQIIGGGGIRTALDTVKSIALGADLVGMAKPFLNCANGGDSQQKLAAFMEDFKYRLTALFLINGAADIKQMQTKPIVITGEAAQRLEARGVNIKRWGNR